MTQLQRLWIDSQQFCDGQVFLSPAQQHYLVRVLRLQAGDRFIAMNGQGQWWLAVLAEAAGQARILQSIAAQTELTIAVTLLIAMPKSGLDEVVRQVTELGVTEIGLVSSQRTVLKPSLQKIDRWQRIAQEAAEQSERQIVPQIHPPQSWVEALQHWNSANSACYLCEARGNHSHLLTCLESGGWRVGSREDRKAVGGREGGEGGEDRGSASQLSCLPDYPPPPLPITVAIGPEGGWTSLEIEQAITAGYQPVSLGSRVLRAVTAPIVALAIVASVYEGF